MKTPMNEPITMLKKQFNFLSMAVHPFPNVDLLTSYNYNTRDIRFLQRYKLKIKRCRLDRLEKKFSINCSYSFNCYCF